ncbi:NADH dehydrogenase [ubiquinone] 1 alpha subcomplex subunit 9, mitochondrial-like [Sycon ciliatum]|uniref:NADH dehydrogenase [ubiquinone] 1 alpha subcomplex subunit 9, mitochondrial-like n=1 Tax=Sycon ciliatum TaxID=27933 RepID=UPI0031F6FCEC
MASASRLAHLPVGSGYRSSFNGLVVTVFGGTGHIGRHLVNRLGREGTQIVTPCRSDDYYAKDLKVCGDLGAVRILPLSLNDEKSIFDSVKYSDVVINCINRQYNRQLGRCTMAEINVDGAERIARICREAGVERYVQMSSVGASEDHPSEYMRTRAAGEAAVRGAFPDATIVRSCGHIGYFDRTLKFIRSNWFALLGFKPVVGGKYHTTVKYPVAVPDVAKGLIAAAMQSDAAGRTYELIGPDKLTVAEMYDLVFASLFKLYMPMPVPEQLLRLSVLAHEFSARAPFFSRDEITRLYCSEEPTPGVPGFEELEIVPSSAKFMIVDALRMYRSHYYEKVSYEDVMFEQQKSSSG